MDVAEVTSPRGPAVSVIKAGMLTTVQDAGRWGYQARGVPVAGPMDPVSHRLANALVGNVRGAALLEVTLMGPELEFEDERVVAMTGAQFELWLDGRQAPSHTPFVVCAGSRLKFGARQLGARAYLAVSGGIAVPEMLGSRSTHLVSAMGGVGGRALIGGDRLPLGDPSTRGPALGPHDPIAPLQSPASGQPILLMADRQTSGGYPKIATVISADMAVAGQLAPHDTITFAVCTTAEAMKALIAQERVLMAVEDRHS